MEITPDLKVSREFRGTLSITLTKQTLEESKAVQVDVPSELTESLPKFRKDYPDPSKVGFLMMQFGTTDVHTCIAEAIRNALTDYGTIVVRADDKDYHDDTFANVQTYMHGCSFGIAVFERLLNEEFNPNVSLEVGYMLALRKPVCLLKDTTMKGLHTDLIGRLYREFDLQRINATIPQAIRKWCLDREMILPLSAAGPILTKISGSV